MNSLSTHILDTTLGAPAAKVSLVLSSPFGETASALTDEDGRCKSWGDIVFNQGIYSLRFEVKPYLLKHHGESFYPYVDICFEMSGDPRHYHVPLLVTPFGYSTYRGS